MALTETKPAPPFSLPDATGKMHSLADYAGKTLVLYFYPKDDTPGCTREACSFRDLHGVFVGKDVVVLGVSPDGPEDHQAFADKFSLPFPLLCDPDRKMMTEYGAFGKKMMYGKEVTGIIRSTVVIGPDGRVLKHWKKVPNAETHPEKVLEFLQTL